MELFSGELTIKLHTVVENDDDIKLMTNNAHEALSTEFFDELLALVEAKGYEVYMVAADLAHIGPANENDVKSLQESVKESIFDAKIIRGETTRVTFKV